MISNVVRFVDADRVAHLKTQNYTTVCSLGYHPLLLYIQENCTFYVKNVILREENNLEDENAVVDLIDRIFPDIALCQKLIEVETIIKLATKHGFYYKTTGIWHKQNPMPRNMNLHFINSTEAWVYFVYKKHTGTFNNNGKAIHDFFETPVTPAGERRFGKHPTQKPVALLEQMVLLLSNEGDVVYDPFAGSGSTISFSAKEP